VSRSSVFWKIGPLSEVANFFANEGFCSKNGYQSLILRWKLLPASYRLCQTDAVPKDARRFKFRVIRVDWLHFQNLDLDLVIPNDGFHLEISYPCFAVVIPDANSLRTLPSRGVAARSSGALM
jgi:hypothetical protein